MVSGRAATRRRQAALEAQRERAILLGAVAVIAVAVLVVLVGVYLTVYRPPRAHVAEIGGEGVSAAELAERASFHMLIEGGATTRQVTGVADFTIDLLAADHVLRQQAPELVGEITEEDLAAGVRERLGSPVDDAAYADALARLLGAVGLSRDEYFELTEVQVLEDRLRERFLGEVPTTGRQLHLLRLRAPTQSNADRVIERARAGEDFQALARQYASDRAAEVDAGWLTVDQLTAEQRAAVEPLAAGEVSNAVTSGLFFDIYKVAEIEEARDLTEAQREALAQQRVDAWIDERVAALSVERDLSSGEAEWVESQVTEQIAEALSQ